MNKMQPMSEIDALARYTAKERKLIKARRRARKSRAGEAKERQKILDKQIIHWRKSRSDSQGKLKMDLDSTFKRNRQKVMALFDFLPKNQDGKIALKDVYRMYKMIHEQEGDSFERISLHDFRALAQCALNDRLPRNLDFTELAKLLLLVNKSISMKNNSTIKNDEDVVDDFEYKLTRLWFRDTIMTYLEKHSFLDCEMNRKIKRQVELKLGGYAGKQIWKERPRFEVERDLRRTLHEISYPKLMEKNFPQEEPRKSERHAAVFTPACDESYIQDYKKLKLSSSMTTLKRLQETPPPFSGSKDPRIVLFDTGKVPLSPTKPMRRSQSFKCKGNVPASAAPVVSSMSKTPVI